MIDLFKPELPDSIYLDDGSSFVVHTDFRYWILFYRFIKMNAAYEDFLIMFPYEKPSEEQLPEAFEKLVSYANPPKEIPRQQSGGNGEIILDYDIDSDYIYAAFMEQYHIDLTDKYLKLHFYKFTALLSALHNTKLNDILSYRCYAPNEKYDYKKQMMELKKIWQLDQAKPEDDEALQYFNSLFD